MFAALLLAVLPTTAPLALPGAPCVCFRLEHAGELALPEKAKPDDLVAETLRIVRASDDVLLRAEALRSALQSIGHRSEAKAPDEVDAARRTLFGGLWKDLKRETELAPMSRAQIVLGKELEATTARLAPLQGVARIEATSKEALTVWFDAQQLPAERLREKLPAGVALTIEAPTTARHANAAITLAFAGQSSTQLGYRVDFDPRVLARQAVDLQPKDARVLILAAMVWFDDGSATSANLAREALRNAQNDEYARKNLVSIFGAFYDAHSIEELETKLEKRAQRG
jgi:hypothetical protein